jgi:hypothetical protein
MPGDKLKVNSNHQDPIHLSLNDLQYPLHQRQQDALAECDRLITHFQKEANQHKRGWQRLRFCGITLSILTTVLSALAASQQLGREEWVVPAVSGLATLFMTLLSQTNAQKVWIRSRSVQQKLHTEKFLYMQSAGEYASMANEESQIRHFSRRVMEIWSEGHKTWEQSLLKGSYGMGNPVNS